MEVQNYYIQRMRKLDRKFCKEQLYLLLIDLYGDIEREKKYEWCTSLYDTNDLRDIINNISSVKHMEFVPIRRSFLPFDFVSEKQKIIIEYDERQHFTKQRYLALQGYSKEICLHYDKKYWKELCMQINAKMNKKVDPLRDEKRALYDSIRDITAYKNGYTLFRIFHGQIDFSKDNAKEELSKLLINK